MRRQLPLFTEQACLFEETLNEKGRHWHKALAGQAEITFCFALPKTYAQVVKLVDTLSSGGSA